MKNKIRSKVAIGDWLIVNCRLVDPEDKGDPDMVTQQELDATRRFVEEATPVEEDELDDFDVNLFEQS